MTDHSNDKDKVEPIGQDAKNETGSDSLEEAEWRSKFKAELDTHLFDDMEVDTTKQREWMAMIRQTETAAPKAGWWTAGRKRMVTGAVAAAIMLGIGIPLFQSVDPTPIPGTGTTNSGGTVEPSPGTSGGIAGPDTTTELSQLVTDYVATLEEAEVNFGETILLPEGMPEGYEIVEIATVGYPGEAALRVHFQYESADGGYLTFSVDKQEAVYPTELFTAVEIGGTQGQVFAQPTLTELFWKLGDIQYSIVGAVNEEQATDMASSTVN